MDDELVTVYSGDFEVEIPLVNEKISMANIKKWFPEATTVGYHGDDGQLIGLFEGGLFIQIKPSVFQYEVHVPAISPNRNRNSFLI